MKVVRKFQDHRLSQRRKSESQIGEKKGVTGEVGVERLLTVEGCQHAAFPDEQIGVALGEFFPSLGPAGAGHALANQKQVGPGDGLVVKLRFSLRGGEASQCGGKFLQRFEGWVAMQVLKCQPDVVGVMETGSRSSAVLDF